MLGKEEGETEIVGIRKKMNPLWKPSWSMRSTVPVTRLLYLLQPTTSFVILRKGEWD